MTSRAGPDPDQHAAQLRKYVDADIDEVYVQQIGPDMEGFFAAVGTRCVASAAGLRPNGLRRLGGQLSARGWLHRSSQAEALW